MPWSNSTFQLLIVTASPAGFSGLFVYSPAPGPGNLIASIAATNGTDAYGNSYKSGVTSYVGAQTAQLTGGQVNVTNQFNTNPGSMSAPSGAGGLVQLFSSQTGAGDASFIASLYSKNGGVLGHPYLLVSNPVNATDPNSGAAEVPHAIGPLLAAGFAAGSVAPTYELVAINGGRVEFGGVINLTANQLAGTTIFTLPAGYHPAHDRFLISPNQLSVTGENTTLHVDTSGNVGMLPSGSTGNTIGLDGVSFKID